VGVGVEAVLANHLLALVRYMSGEMCYELQTVHLLTVTLGLSILTYVEGQVAESRDGLGHVPCHPLGVLRATGGCKHRRSRLIFRDETPNNLQQRYASLKRKPSDTAP
jgi:predicted alpha/beta hydrolase